MLNLGEPIEKSNLREKVLAILRKNLITGDLAEGELYSASAIAAHLGVSTSPVREALITLSSQGVMEPVRNRGFRVVPLSDEDMQEIYEMRTLLEVPATVQLAGNPQLIARQSGYRDIARRIVAAAQAGDIVEFLRNDLEFHLGILSFLNNGRLISTVRALRDQTRQGRLASVLSTPEFVELAESHEVILDAIVDGDAERVRELMIEHIGHVRTDWDGVSS